MVHGGAGVRRAWLPDAGHARGMEERAPPGLCGIVMPGGAAARLRACYACRIIDPE